MNNGLKSFDSDLMNSIALKSRQMSNSLSNTKSRGGQLLSGSLLGGGISKLDNAMQKASQNIGNISNIISSQTDAIFTAEATMTSEAESISIPNNFNISDFNPINQNHEGTSESDKGKGVNTEGGIDQEKFKDFVKATELRLDDITKERTQEQEMEDKYSEKEELLKNINEDQTQEQTYEDAYSEEEEQLKNINEDETQKQEYEDNYSGNEGQLENINEDETQKKDFEDNYVESDKTLEELNQNVTEQQEYKDDALNDLNQNLQTINSNMQSQQNNNDENKESVPSYSSDKENDLSFIEEEQNKEEFTINDDKKMYENTINS